MKKEKSKGALVAHIIFSFLVWQLVFYFLLELVLSSLVDSMFGSSVAKIIIEYNLLWIVADVLSLVVTYFFNRHNTSAKENLPSAKMLALIWIYILTIVVNVKNILYFVKYNAVVEIICVLVHIAVIYALNDKLFKKFVEK